MQTNGQQYWIDHDGTFTYGHVPRISEKLDVGVYELGFGGLPSQWTLTRMGEDFNLPPKIYDLEPGLVDRILHTYNTLDKNFGVVLKGLKGTGKTVVAKILCNKLKLPVILVTHPWDNIAGFVNSIDQEVILLFDEFEKIYDLYAYNENDDDPNANKKSISTLLMLMDGVYSSRHKRLFILTTNKDNLPDAMLSRPTRIRYIKEFSDLGVGAIREILQDSLEDKAHMEPLIDYLKTLEIITVDIVKALAEEVNMYKDTTPEFLSMFNVKKSNVTYNLYMIDPETQEKEYLMGNLKLAFESDYNFEVGASCRVNGRYIGEVQSFDPETLVLVTERQDRTDPKDPHKTENVTRHFLFEKSQPCHYAFY